MGDIIDINVQVAVDEVTINATPNNYIINVNRIIGEQVQSDFNVTDDQAPDYIKNKPIIPAAVTKTSDLTNDGEDGINPFITLNDIPPSTSTLNDVLTNGNTSLLDAKIGTLGLWDTSNSYYNKIGSIGNAFYFMRNDGVALFVTEAGYTRFSTDYGTLELSNAGIIGSKTISWPDASGTVALTSDIPVGGLTSVGLTMPLAFSVANSPLTSDGTIDVTAIGTSSQYIRGDGQLATLPTGAGGGSTVSYYLNGSINASVAGYKQLSNTATIGGGTDFILVGNGLIAQFLTDAGNPNRIEIPGGAWNFEMFFQANSAGGNQKFYVELLKYDGITFTSIASSISVPEEITGGTAIDLYLTSLAVPTTPLLVTDRLAIRVYIVDNAVGRTITLHTEDNTLCEIITTFSGGVTSLNGLTANTQYLGIGTLGSDFNISSLSETHTFNLPTASATNRGALSSTDWSIFNGKQNALTNPITGTGTTNYLPKFTAGSTLGNSVMIESAGNIGIGITPTLGKLHIEAGNIFLRNLSASEFTFKSTVGNVANHKINFAAAGGNSAMIAAIGTGNFNRVNIQFWVNGASTGDGVNATSADNVMQLNSSNVSILRQVILTGTVKEITGAAGNSEAESDTTFKGGSNVFQNRGGGKLFLAGGAGAGTGVGGDIIFKTALAGTTSGVTNALNEVIRITYDGKLAIGTTSPNASSILDITSTTKGFLPPRMTTTQKNAIATPMSGLVVYDTTLGKLCVRGASAWETITSV